MFRYLSQVTLLFFITYTAIFAQNHILHLDGDGDYVSIPSVLLDDNDFTIEAWAYMDGPGGGLDAQNTIFEHRDYDTEFGASAVILNAESPTVGQVTRFNIRTDNGPQDIVETARPDYAEWHHYAGVVRPDSVFLFLDGQLVDATENHQEGVFNQSIDLIDIGRHYHSIGYVAGYFNGYIDNMRVWSGALSAVEVSWALNSELHNIQHSLLAHWDFETLDDVAFDQSLSGHDGILMDNAEIIVDPAAPIESVWGDLNDDGQVNVSDVIVLIDYILGN